MSEADRLKWDARYAARGAEGGDDEPRAWLRRIAGRLPRQGRALDLAAGEGQTAVFLAGLGLTVEALDVSPVGLARAARRAAEAGVTVTTRVVDLTTAAATIAPGRYDVITCLHYLQRALAPAMAEGLRPGGVVAVELAGAPNLTRHAHPSARFLVAEGELLTWFPGLEVLEHAEGWEEGRFLCRILARRPA